jgi:hypothetical protein
VWPDRDRDFLKDTGQTYIYVTTEYLNLRLRLNLDILGAEQLVNLKRFSDIAISFLRGSISQISFTECTLTKTEKENRWFE